MINKRCGRRFCLCKFATESCIRVISPNQRLLHYYHYLHTLQRALETAREEKLHIDSKHAALVRCAFTLLQPCRSLHYIFSARSIAELREQLNSRGSDLERRVAELETEVLLAQLPFASTIASRSLSVFFPAGSRNTGEEQRFATSQHAKKI